MKKFFILFLSLLATFSSFSNACGVEGHEESQITNFGFSGGLIFSLILIIIILLLILFNERRSKKWK